MPPFRVALRLGVSRISAAVPPLDPSHGFRTLSPARLQLPIKSPLRWFPRFGEGCYKPRVNEERSCDEAASPDPDVDRRDEPFAFGDTKLCAKPGRRPA